MERKSFIIYIDTLSVLNELSDAQAGKLFKVIKEYHLRDAERSRQDGDVGFDDLMSDFLIRVAFAPFKAQFDRDGKEYEKVCQKRKEAGIRGGAKYGNSNAKKSDSKMVAHNNKQNKQMVEKTSKTSKCQQNNPDSDSDSDSDSDISTPTNVVVDNDSALNTNGFIPPPLEDMQNYFDEKGYTKDAAEKAYAYYTELGWVDSRGNAIKNWKLKCLTVWFKDENKKHTRPWGYSIAT